MYYTCYLIYPHKAFIYSRGNLEGLSIFHFGTAENASFIQFTVYFV